MYDFKKEVETKLLSLPHSHRISRNQIAMRCKFCGDSKKDPRKTRFYVLLNLDSDAPIVYNCFNCNESGILTPSVLRTFEINDLQLNSNLITFNKQSITKVNKHLNRKDNSYNFCVPIPKNTKLNILKKKYIEDRLGITLSLKQLLALKVIFSLEDFLVQNDIEEVNANKQRANRLNDEYVGFLSARNEYIIYRDITGKNKLRYDKYTIIENIENNRKFYVIPTKIDVMTTETIYINMAEGVFDILGVYFHVKNQKDKNNIYVAICDSSYANVIKYFIKLGLIGDNIIVNIYSDDDHDEYFYKNMINELSPWVKQINLYYNTLSKDFGVHKKDINVVKRT